MNKIFIIDDCGIIPTPSGNTCPIMANIIEACDSDNSIILNTSETIINKTITPSNSFVNLGNNLKRFREINTYSGNSTVWISTEKIITPEINLGLDSMSNNRIITADSSILIHDILNGGDY